MDIFFSFFTGLFLGIILTFVIFIKKKGAEENLQAKFLMEFENAANKILKQNSEEFSKLGKKEIENLITPFREKIIEFEQRVEKNRIDEAKELSSLETQVKMLANNNREICQEANNLATAIKGESKTRGNWGEVLLERILEVSGLQKDIHYSTQKSFRDSENKILRPDVIINLPDSRHLVIDSKVSLISYEKYYNCEDRQDTYLKEFINSVREHIKNLRSKFYQDIKDINSPDFVLMFIPIEASFGVIMQNDSDILDFAWKNKILLVSPSTLLVTLKNIELFWQRENQNRNVIEIAEESGKLYDKFVGLLMDMEAVKNYFSKTVESFENIDRKLVGRSGLIGQAEKIKELGAKTSKEIPEKHLEKEICLSSD